MQIAFVLSMPNVGSWNGQWSGAGRLYAQVRSVGRKAAERVMQKGSYSYNFGDGWRACVEVRQVKGPEVRQIRKNSKGFCGYDWMIDSIIYDGAIYGPTQPKPAQEVTP